MPRLEYPDARYCTTYLEALAEFRAEGCLRALHAELFHASAGFEDFVVRLLEKTDGTKLLEDGRVPETVMWLLEAETLIGRVSIRHELNAALREFEVTSVMRSDLPDGGWGAAREP